MSSLSAAGHHPAAVTAANVPTSGSSDLTTTNATSGALTLIAQCCC